MTLTLRARRRAFADELAEALTPALRRLGCQRDGEFLHPAVVAQALEEVTGDWHVKRDLDHLRDAEGTVHDGTDLRGEVVEPSVDLVAWRVRTGWRPVKDAGPADETPVGVGIPVDTTEPTDSLAEADWLHGGEVRSVTDSPPTETPTETQARLLTAASRPADTLAMLGQTRWWRAKDSWVQRRDMSVAHKASVVAWLERHVEILHELAISNLFDTLLVAPADPSDGVAAMFATVEGELDHLLALRRPDARDARLAWLRSQPLYRRLARDVARGLGAGESSGAAGTKETHGG